MNYKPVTVMFSKCEVTTVLFFLLLLLLFTLKKYSFLQWYRTPIPDQCMETSLRATTVIQA